MVIQERDRVIKELEEKVAFLEAEVRNASPVKNILEEFQLKGQSKKMEKKNRCDELISSKKVKVKGEKLELASVLCLFPSCFYCT